MIPEYGATTEDTEQWEDPDDGVHPGQPGPGASAHDPNGPDDPNGTNGRHLTVTRASTVRPRRLRWLWQRRIPVGGLTLLAGREGLGKSTVAVDLTAQVTRGQLDGEHHGRPRTVVYVASEDSREYVIVPRLLAAGADLDRVIFLDARDPDGMADRVVLPLDTRRLADVVRAHDVSLVVLDAATSVIDSRLDGNADRQMRQGLEAIGQMADRTGCAVLGIVHFGKRADGDTGRLILGSIAWSQVARSVLAVAATDDGDLVLSATKANLAPGDTPSMTCRVVEALIDTEEGPAAVGQIKWGGETEQHARDLLGVSDEDREDNDDAADWLLAYLTNEGGSAKAADIFTAARAQHIAERTLKRARKRARPRVLSRREGFQGGAVWSIDTETPERTAQSGQSGHPGQSGHTQDRASTDDPDGRTP